MCVYVCVVYVCIQTTYSQYGNCLVVSPLMAASAAAVAVVAVGSAVAAADVVAAVAAVAAVEALSSSVALSGAGGHSPVARPSATS